MFLQMAVRFVLERVQERSDVVLIDLAPHD